MSDYNNYFLGSKEEDLNKKAITQYFDINYLPLKHLPISYFSMNDLKELEKIHNNDPNNKKLIDDYLIKINKTMNNNINNFNSFNILPIIIVLFIFYIFLMIFILRIIQFNYPLYYVYILIGIIGILLLITSLWFLYINSNIL